MLEQTWYERVLAALNDAGVSYLVAGGIAVNLHGVPRFTKDLDLYIDWDAANVNRLLAALQTLGFSIRQPVNPALLADPVERGRIQREKNVIAFTFYATDRPFQEVDLLLIDSPPYQEAARRAVSRQAGTLVFPVVAIADLITMKTAGGRLQDESDIAALRQIAALRRELP